MKEGGWEARDRNWEATQGFAPPGRGYRYQSRESKGAGGVTWVQEVEPPARGWSWPGLCGGSWCQEKHTVTVRDTENRRKILPSPFLPPSKLTTASFQWPHPTQHLLVATPNQEPWGREPRADLGKNGWGGGGKRPRAAHFCHPKAAIAEFPCVSLPFSPGKKWTFGKQRRHQPLLETGIQFQDSHMLLGV